MHFLDSTNIPVNKCTKLKSRDIVSKLVFYAQSTGKQRQVTRVCANPLQRTTNQSVSPSIIHQPTSALHYKRKRRTFL